MMMNKDVKEISAEIYDAISKARRTFEIENSNTPNYVKLPRWVYNWLTGEASAMGVYIEDPADIWSVKQYMGMWILVNDAIDELDEIEVF